MHQPHLELRSIGNAEQQGNTLSGYCAVFDSPTEIRSQHGTFKESIKPGDFTKSLQGNDIVFCLDHDEAKILGRFPGSLKLTQDSKGLRFEQVLGDCPLHLDTKYSVSNQDLKGCSIAWDSCKDKWLNKSTRILEEINLRHLALVVRPAYETTTCDLRSVTYLSDEALYLLLELQKK
jgi:hypothetical protein